MATSGASPWTTLLKWLTRLLLTISVFGLAFVPLRGSQDEWWHLKTGQWIWQHHTLPLNDIFTYTGVNTRWYNHEWLSQLIFYGSWRTMELWGANGLLGLILLKSLVVVLTFVLVANLARQRYNANPSDESVKRKSVTGYAVPVACVVALVAADISRRTIFPRPPIFSYLLLAVFLLIFYGWKRGKVRFKTLWLLVPLTILWANLHGMVLLSFIVAGAFAAGEFLENLVQWFRDRYFGEVVSFGSSVFTRSLWGLCALTVALIAATLAQPSGYHIFFLGHNFTSDPLLQKIILEMKPTPAPFAVIDPARHWWQLGNLAPRPPGFWTFWVALVVGFILFARNKLRFTYAADYLLVGFFTFQGVMHWRLLPLFAIVAAGPAAGLIYARIDTWKSRARSVQGTLFAGMLVALVAWFNFTVAEPPPQTFFQRNMQMFHGEFTNPFDYPAPLMDYIVEAKLPDNMFSDSNYCGYFIWRLSPEHHKLFTDNRFDVFGSKFIREERTVFFAANKGDRIGDEPITESWQDILNRYKVNFIVFRPVDRVELFDALVKSDQWRMVYYFIPKEAVRKQWPYNGNYVWVRKNADSDAIAARSAKIFQRQFPDQPLPEKVWNDIVQKVKP